MEARYEPTYNDLLGSQFRGRTPESLTLGKTAPPFPIAHYFINKEALDSGWPIDREARLSPCVCRSQIVAHLQITGCRRHANRQHDFCNFLRTFSSWFHICQDKQVNVFWCKYHSLQRDPKALRVLHSNQIGSRQRQCHVVMAERAFAKQVANSSLQKARYLLKP